MTRRCSCWTRRAGHLDAGTTTRLDVALAALAASRTVIRVSHDQGSERGRTLPSTTASLRCRGLRGGARDQIVLASAGVLAARS